MVNHDNTPSSTPNITPGMSGQKAMIFFVVLLVVIVSAIIILGKMLLNTAADLPQALTFSTPASSTPSKPPLRASAETGNSLAKIVDDILVGTTEVKEGYTAISHRLSFKQSDRSLEIAVTGGDSYQFTSPKDQRGWIGILTDPYQPLVNLSGTPFFSGEGLPIKPAANIQRMTNGKGMFAVTRESFIPFPFFSAKASTIGIIEGFYDAKTTEARLKITFFDREQNLTAIIHSEEIAFPQWLQKGVFPPPYTTQKFLSIHKKNQWYGENVVATLQRFRQGAYEEHPQGFKTFCLKELSDDFIGPKDLEVLKKIDISKSEYSEKRAEPVKKLIRFAYYSKKTGQTDLVRALLPAMHPSIRKGILENKELAP